MVPKLFRIKFFPETSAQGMKLTVKKIRYIINHKKKGESSESIRKDMKISKRRVEQIWKFYSETGKEPIIAENMGRPVKTLDPKEEEIISIAFDRYKFGARMLEKNPGRVLRNAYTS
jgi:transposase